MRIKRILSPPLAVLLLLAALVPSVAAAEESLPRAPAGHVVQAPWTANPADYIPVDRTENEINGVMTIVEVFEVSPNIDPNTLVKDNFEKNGFLFSMDSIIKDEEETVLEKDVEVEHTIPTTSKDMGENLKLLPFSVVYDQDGFVGELYLDPQSVTISATDQEARYNTKRSVQTYNFSTNDPSQIPQSHNGLPLKDVSWAVASYMEDSSIPTGYTATATYSKTSSWMEDSAWNVTATYLGTAIYSDLDTIQYTVTYYGQEVPEGYEIVDGQIALIEEPEPEGPNIGGVVLRILGIVLLLAAIAFAILFLLWALKKGLLSSNKITIQAQDDASGEYTVIQKVKVNKKAPSFSIDTLKAPASKHFICEMSAKQAMRLRGKIINISADGIVVSKHKVEPINDSDKYIFTVDLEAVDSGPIDTFAL